MEINKFIEEFNSSSDKVKTIKKHITTDYIAFERKIAICELIAKKMILDNGDLIKNTPMVYEHFVISLLREYTDVDVISSEALEILNALERNGITEYLISAIGNDANRFNTILDMTVNDTIDNHNNIVNHLSIKSDNVNFMLDKIQTMLVNLPKSKNADVVSTD